MTEVKLSTSLSNEARKKMSNVSICVGSYNLNFIEHLAKTACQGKISFRLFSRDQNPILETVVFSAVLVFFT